MVPQRYCRPGRRVYACGQLQRVIGLSCPPTGRQVLSTEALVKNDDLKGRVAELATAAGIDLTTERILPERCWVDGSVRCPYGQPYGQYILRPEGFCHTTQETGNGCNVYHRHAADKELSPALENDAVRGYFEQEKTSVVSELQTRAGELPEASPRRLVLELAADILESCGLDRAILLEDDLPG